MPSCCPPKQTPAQRSSSSRRRSWRLGHGPATTGKNSSGELDLSGVEVGSTEWSATPRRGWLAIHKTLGYSAFQLGVLERALELTAEYARTREQFDRPIGASRPFRDWRR